jgi:hypothetical protein
VIFRVREKMVFNFADAKFDPNISNVAHAADRVRLSRNEILAAKFFMALLVATHSQSVRAQKGFSKRQIREL